jgi:hypothetical protein
MAGLEACMNHLMQIMTKNLRGPGFPGQI